VTSPGSYFVTVIDSGNCVATSNVTIVQFLDNTTVTTSGGSRNDNIVDEPPNQSLDSSRKTSDLVPIVGGVLGGFLLMILAILIFVLIRKRRSKDLPLNDISLTEMNSSSSIPATTLKGIKVLEVIGTGQFGKVYRGMMNSTHVALKEITSRESNVSKEAEILS
jgi:hypothetical protein